MNYGLVIIVKYLKLNLLMFFALMQRTKNQDCKSLTSKLRN